MIFNINLQNTVLFNIIENNELKINLNFREQKNIIFSVKTHKNINLFLNEKMYNIIPNIQINIIINTDNYINIIARRLYNEQINYEDIEFINIHEYGNPMVINSLPYQIVYSFDKNYFVGGFASIYSLLFNFKNNNLNDLNINIFLPIRDYESFIIYYEKLIKYIENNISFSIYLIDDFIIDKDILETTCFKGGNHLLKLSNYSRLLIGHLINVKNVLYIDADTIIQKDVSKIFENLDNNFIIMGKQSNLNYNNLFNSNNKHIFSKYINNNSQEIFLKKVIYTGTLIINPQNLKNKFNDMIDIVKLHNSVSNKGGLYKLFTMSILNIGLFNNINYFDNILKNVVDLGHNATLDIIEIENADILDWSGIYKPWYKNGLYHDLWKKYNLFFDVAETISTNKNTTEKFNI